MEFNKKSNKKAMELPINIVVMMIIGIIIFALGMSLFTKMSNAGDDQIRDLNNKVQNDILSLQCEGDDWICSPSNVMKMGATKTFSIFIANKGDFDGTFSIDLPKLENLDGKKGLTKSCGSILIYYQNGFNIKVKSGNSAKIPFIVKSGRVKKTPCSFVTELDLKKSGVVIGKTPLIIRVE